MLEKGVLHNGHSELIMSVLASRLSNSIAYAYVVAVRNTSIAGTGP